jgi:ankyrin repeat protein
MMYEAYGEAFGDLFELFEVIVHQDDTERFEKYLDEVADIDMRNAYGWTLLHLCVRRGRKAMCETLLERGADIDAKDNEGWTPLMEAMMQGHIDIAEMLIERGADLNATTRMGDTPRTLAEKFGLTSLMRYVSSEA